MHEGLYRDLAGNGDPSGRFAIWRVAVALIFGLVAASVHAFAREPAPARQAELLSILQQDCGSCHGLTLKGGLGPSLLPDHLQGKTREMLIATVRDGRPGTAMPPWRPILDDDEIAWIVDQLMAGKGAAR